VAAALSWAGPGPRGGALEEGFSAIVTAQSTTEGSLSIRLQPTDGAGAIALDQVVLALTVRLFDQEIVRVTVANPATGSVAYFQGALPAVLLAREIGLRLIR
jgi:hypothetical protein